VTNPFLALADRQLPAHVKARLRRAERRLEARDRLTKAYEQKRQQEIDDALAGPHGPQLATLIASLPEISLDQETDLIDLAQPWRSANPDARFLALRLIDDRIIKLREAAGLAPFDDPLPHEQSSAFIRIREALQ
jgi:hypothetical protein